MQGDAAVSLGVFERVNRGEMAIGQRRVGQRPEMLGGLEFRRIGWQKEQMDMVGHAQFGAAVLAHAVKDEHDLLVWARAHLARKRGEFDLEERNADGRGEMEDGAIRGGMQWRMSAFKKSLPAFTMA